MKNIVIINRWSKLVGFTDFENYIDHKKYQVHYITIKSSLNAIKEANKYAVSVSVVEDLSLAQLSLPMQVIIEAFGKVDVLIAMAEKDLLVAGQLRDMYGIEGMSYEFTRRFIDKSLMKSFIEKANIATPKYKNLDEDLSDLQYPLILKPKSDSSSRGVTKIFSRSELIEHWPQENSQDFLLEEFCPDEIYHLDGFVCDGKIRFQVASQYIGTCLDHSLGEPLGSVAVSDESKNKMFLDFAQKVVQALQLKGGSYHLECFLVENEKDSTPVFLEIAARAGGGDLRELLCLAKDFNIVKAWIDLQLGVTPQIPDASLSHSMGFVVFPGPVEARIVNSTSSFSETVSVIAKEYIFPNGHRLSGGHDIFANSLGRYLFVGEEQEIRSAIAKIKINFKVSFQGDIAARSVS